MTRTGGHPPSRRLTNMTSVRFDPAVIEAVKDRATEEGITVGKWMRRLVGREIEQPGTFDLHLAGEDEPLRIPEDALQRVMTALMPALMKHGILELRVGTPLWRQDGQYCLTSAIPVTASAPPAGGECPKGLIPDSGRCGEPKVLKSSLSRPSLLRAFACPHLSIGGATFASCGICGPLTGGQPPSP